jgi:hypothetical protein
MANEFVARNGVIALSNSTITGSLIVTAGITGSLSGSHVGNTTGTASWATSASSAITASYVLQAVSSSFATLAQTANTASYIVTAQTASYVLQAVSASFSTSASYALSASFAPAGAATLTGGSTNYIARWASATALTTGSIYDNGSVGVSTTAPGGRLDVSYGGNLNDPTLLLGAQDGTSTRTNLSIKIARVAVAHYNNNSTSSTILVADSNTTANRIFIGGGTGFHNAATDIYFYTGTTTASLTGTPQMRITGSNIGMGTLTPLQKLVVVDTVNSYAGVFLGINGDTAVAIGNVAGNTGSIQTANTASTAVRNLVINPLVAGQGGNVGIGQSNPQYRLDVTGSTRITTALAVGAITPSATVGRIDASNDVVAFSTSDINFKTNIYPISGALDKITQIGGYEFDWIPNPEYHGFTGHDVGVIAQEIEKVLPEVVTTRDSGYKGVKYEKIVPLLIQAIKEQQKQIEELQHQINYLVENK